MVFYTTPFDLIALVTLSVGLAFALLLWLARGPEAKANRFLCLALFLLSLCIIGVLVRYPWPLNLSLAIAPLLYLYVRQLTKPDHQTSYQDMRHFVPVTVQLVLQIAGMEVDPAFNCCSALIYLYLSDRAIIKFYDEQQFQEGDRFRTHLKGVQISLAGLGLSVFLWVAYGLVNLLFFQRQLPYFPGYLLLAAMLIRMAALAIIKPVARPVALITPGALRRSDLRQKSAWLKKAVQTGRYYQDPELTLSTLAEKLLLTTHELSRIINQGLKKSFNDFINAYRVAEVIQKMQDPAFDHLNLAGIAYASGFNSKSTFHRIFKQMTGKSPAEYKAQQPKELPSYKLRPGGPASALILRQPNRHFMFKNFLKIAFRNFRSNKLSTLINVISLSVGTTAALVIYLIIHFDLSFDRFHTDRDRIYRVVTNFSSAGQESYNAGIPGAAIELTKNQLSQVDASARLFTLYQPHVIITTGAAQTDLKAQDNVILTDDGYFRLFTYHWLAGNAGQALARPNRVVLTASQAKKYFPALNYGDMLGRIVQYVFIDYNHQVAGEHNFENRKFTTSERKRVAQQIADYIYSVGTGSNVPKPAFIEKVSYVPNPEPRLDVNLSENYLAKEGFSELLLDTIRPKELRAETYLSSAAVKNCWLLIVLDGVSSYSGFDLQTVTFPRIAHSNFQRIYLLEAISHRIRLVYPQSN